MEDFEQDPQGDDSWWEVAQSCLTLLAIGAVILVTLDIVGQLLL